MELDFQKRYQTMLTLWFALVVSQALWLLIIFFAAPPFSSEPHAPTESLIIVGLTMLGALLVLVSFLVKKAFLKRAVAEQNPNLMQQGMVLGCALCEGASLLGVLERFLIANREYFWLFLIAAVGMMLHFPTRSKLEAASHQNKGL